MHDLKRHPWVKSWTAAYMQKVPVHKRQEALDYVLAETDTTPFLGRKLLIIWNFTWNAGQWYTDLLGVDEEQALTTTRFNMYAATIIRQDRKLIDQPPLHRHMATVLAAAALFGTSYLLVQTLWFLLLLGVDLITQNTPLLLRHFAAFLQLYVVLNAATFLLTFHASCLAFGEHFPHIMRLIERWIPGKNKNPFEKWTLLDRMLGVLIYLGWKLNEQTINHLTLNCSQDVKAVIRTLSQD